MVTRSAGLPTGHGFVTGGGFRGATDELDEAVQEAARALVDSYPGYDVTIRFNSDRLSGGAWLVTDGKDSFGANAEIGIGAYLVTQEGIDQARDRYGIEPVRTPGVYTTAHIGRRALRSRWIANESGYYHDTHESIPSAQRFVLLHGSLRSLPSPKRKP